MSNLAISYENESPNYECFLSSPAGESINNRLCERISSPQHDRDTDPYISFIDRYRHRQKSSAHFGPLIAKISNLLKYNLNKDDSDPPIKSSISDSIMFIKSLPLDMPIPEAFLETDGSVCLEWQKGESLMVLSILGDSTISWYGRKKIKKDESTGTIDIRNSSELTNFFTVFKKKFN